MRPKLDTKLTAETFLDYYWLKEELAAFCREHSIPASGGKKEITGRIALFLDTGEILKSPKEGYTAKGYRIGNKTSGIKRPVNMTPELDSPIPAGYRNDEIHRAFFKSVIGDRFKFNVPFMNWMKQNAGKPYREAVDEWYRIADMKKAGRKETISPQFEYNQYTRDFFKANPAHSRKDAITCWKYKRSIPGNNRYEDEDLQALDESC